MKYEWNNVWMHKTGEWHPLQATSEEQALRELEAKMPYTEDGTIVRITKDDGSHEIVKFVPASAPALNFGPF